MNIYISLDITRNVLKMIFIPNDENIMMAIENNKKHKPCPNLAIFCESEGELGSAFDLDDTHTRQALNQQWNITTVTTPSAQLAKVTVSPRK